MDEQPQWTYRVRSNHREQRWDVIERNTSTMQGDGERVMDTFPFSDPDARRKAERYCLWLRGWSVDEIDAEVVTYERFAG